jgi:hypothetical protein
MKNDRIKADTIKETEAKGEFVKLSKDGTAKFYYCKLGRLGRV